MKLKVRKICLKCGKEFEVKPSRETTAKYCSPQCRDISKRTRIPRKCEICGNEFYVKPSKYAKGNGRFCSRECSAKGQILKVKKVCQWCGKEFEIPPAWVRKGEGKYCSKACSAKGLVKWIERICLNCNKKFLIKPFELRAPKLYCSNKCKGEYMSGPNSPGWRGGVSFEPYCTKFNEGFKERVREFWGRKCGICGKPEHTEERRLAVHHVNYEKMVCCDNTPPLFVSLCAKCHGKTSHNREYWEYILTEYIMTHFDGDSYLPEKGK